LGNFFSVRSLYFSAQLSIYNSKIRGLPSEHLWDTTPQEFARSLASLRRSNQGADELQEALENF
jgi:hypothetical protein